MLNERTTVSRRKKRSTSYREVMKDGLSKDAVRVELELGGAASRGNVLWFSELQCSEPFQKERCRSLLFYQQITHPRVQFIITVL